MPSPEFVRQAISRAVRQFHIEKSKVERLRHEPAGRPDTRPEYHPRPDMTDDDVLKVQGDKRIVFYDQDQHLKLHRTEILLLAVNPIGQTIVPTHAAECAISYENR